MPVQFTDNSMQVKAELNEAAIAWLYEAAGEVKSAAKRNSRVDTSDLKTHWSYKVDESKGQATIGNPLENAIWEEFGTGEYALEGNGRKGGWYIHESKLSPKAKSRMKKVIGKNGEVFYFTKGKKPNRTLFNAFTNNEAKLKRRLESILKERMQ